MTCGAFIQVKAGSTRKCGRAAGRAPLWAGLVLWLASSLAIAASSVGELDYRVPANNALMNFAMQQRLNVPSKLLVFPDENHWILKGENSRYFYSEVHGWLAKYLK